MHLYISANNINVELADVTLIDGWLPCMSGRQSENEKRQGGTEDCRLEPAIWFKVMIIDSLSIDCTAKIISWSQNAEAGLPSDQHLLEPRNKDSGINSYCSTEDGPLTPPSGESRYKHRIEQSAYDTGADYCAGYSDLDEVFDNMPALLAKFQDNQITTASFHDEIARLLHLYVLPSVRLTAENIDSLRRCLASQESNLSRIDADILSRSDKGEEIRSRRKRERSRFVDELTSSSGDAASAYGETFAKVLFDDLTTDIAEASVVLDTAQMAVDSGKLSTVTDDTRIELDNKLARIRMERNESHDLCSRLIEAREALREFTKAGKSKMKRIYSRLRRVGSTNSIQHIYVALKEKEDEVTAEILALTDRKLLAISVKEAMRATLGELALGVKETYVVDLTPIGARNATDVLTTGSVSRDWQTLTQQVALILSNPTHALSKKHFVFCRKCIERCTAAETAYRRAHDELVASCESSDFALRFSNSTRSTDSIASSAFSGRSNGEYASMLSESTLSDGGQETGRQSKSSESVSRQSSAVESRKKISRSISKKMKWPFKTQHSATFHSYVPDYIATSPPSEPFPGMAEGILINRSTSESDTGNSPPQRFSPEQHSMFTDSCDVDSSHLSTKTHAQDFAREISLSSSQNTLRPRSAHSVNSQMSRNSRADDLIFKPGADGSEDGIKKVIDGLRTDIVAHFDATCKALQAELARMSQRYYNKLWVVYESHFYEATMDALCRLYTLQYTSVTSSLCESVKTLTVVDLSLENAILAHMLENLTGVVDGSPSPSEVKLPEPEATVAKDDNVNARNTSQYASLLRKNQKPRAVVPDECKENQSSAEEARDEISDLTISEDDKHLINKTGRRTVTEGVDFNLDRKLNAAVDILVNDRLLITAEDTTENYPQESDFSPRKLVASDGIPGQRRSSEMANGSRGEIAVDDSVAILRRHLSSPNHQSRLSTVRLSLVLQGPLPGVIVYERTLCPVRESLRLAAAASADPATIKSQTAADEPETEILQQTKTLRLKPHYRKQFALASECIDNALKSRTPAAKLQYLSHCLREVSHQISVFFAEINEGKYLGACSDELMDALVILLCNVDDLSQLYSQIMILADIVPPFLTSGPSSFTLVQFVGACQFVQERIVMKRKRLADDESVGCKVTLE